MGDVRPYRLYVMPRTSLNVSRVVTRPLKRRYYTPAGVLAWWSDAPASPNDTFVELRNTSNTPGYRSQRVSHLKDGLPMNQFLYFKNVRTFPTGFASIHYNDGWYETWVGSPDATAGWTASLSSTFLTPELMAFVDQDALKASLSDLKGMKVNLGVAFGERNRTAQLVKGTATKFANAITSLRKGSVPGALNALGYSGKRKAPKATKQLAADWLAIQYGWKPLLSDVYGAAETLARHGTYRVRISTSRTRRWSYTDTTVGTKWNEVPVRRSESGQYTRKYVYIFSHSSGVVTDLTSVGLTNPLAVAWELLPWSFVFDWFLKVGEWIDSLDATLGLQFEKGSSTSFQRYSVGYKVNGTAQTSSGLHVSNGSASSYWVRCERTPLSGFVHMTRPNLGTFLNPTRTANAIALLTQRIVK